jgi:hypothetical protein
MHMSGHLHQAYKLFVNLYSNGLSSSQKPHQVCLLCRSGVVDHDKVLATVATGHAQEGLKHAEPTVKTWTPTKEDLEADATEQRDGGVPRG